MTRLGRLAWFTLIVNVGVVLFGALVRATGSGAGCGATWPTCEGEVLPALDGARAIEFTHRATSGFALILVVALGVAVIRSQRGIVRFMGLAAIVSILVEALIGAWIVLYRLVADDDSLARLVSVPLHLVNTLVLLAVLTLVAWWLTVERVPQRPLDRRVVRLTAGAVVAMLLLSATGAVTALADTLVPASSLREGLAADFDGGALTALRIVHPILAVIVAAYLGWYALRATRPMAARLGRGLLWLLVVQMLAGVVNVVLLVPVWMQLIHLLFADAVWIVTVIYANELLTETSDQASWARTSSAEVTGAPQMNSSQT